MDESIKKFKQRRDARLKKRLDEFEENDHPRDENGRFTSGGGGRMKSGPNRAIPAKNLPPKETTPLRNGARIVRGTKGVGAEGRGKGAYPGIQSFGKEEPGESEALAKAGMMGEKAKKPDAVKRANKMKEMPEGTVIKTSVGDTFTKRGDNRWRVESKDGRVKIWDNKYAATLLNDDDVDGGSGKDKSTKESSSAKESGEGRPRPRTKLEVMKQSKDNYSKVQEEIKSMKPGIERDVKEKLILPWIKGTNWTGGISDSKFSQIAKRMPYSFDDVYNEFQKQMMKY